MPPPYYSTEHYKADSTIGSVGSTFLLDWSGLFRKHRGKRRNERYLLFPRCSLKTSRVYMCLQWRTIENRVGKVEIARPAPYGALLQHKWVVFVAAVMVGFLNYGILATFGTFYVGMLNTYNAGRAKTALVQSLLTVFSMGLSVVSGYLVSRFGVRVVTFCAAIMTALGFTLSFFSTTIYELYGFISVLAGFGVGTLYVSAVVCVGHIFSGRQKSIALAVHTGGTAMGGFVWPKVISALLEAYSLRGAFLVLGGILLNNLPCAFIFGNCESGNRTVKHEIVVRYDQKQTQCAAEISEIDSDLDMEEKKTLVVRKVIKDTSEIYIEKKSFQSDTDNGMIAKHRIIGENTYKENITRMIGDKIKTSSNDGACDGHHGNRSKTKYLNEGNVDSSEAIHETIKLGKHDVRSADNCLNENAEQTRLTLSNVESRKHKLCLSSNMVLFSIYTIAGVLNISTVIGFLTLYQDINVFNGLTIAQSDLTFMCFALSSISSKWMPITVARFKHINSFTVPVVTSLCGAVGQLILLTTSSFTSTIIAMVFTAVSDGGWFASMQVIVFELLPIDKQAVGFGFVLTSIGMASGATGPIYGSIRDSTSSYQTVLLITTGMYLTNAVLEVICLVISQRLKNKQGIDQLNTIDNIDVRVHT